MLCASFILFSSVFTSTLTVCWPWYPGVSWCLESVPLSQWLLRCRSNNHNYTTYDICTSSSKDNLKYSQTFAIPRLREIYYIFITFMLRFCDIDYFPNDMLFVLQAYYAYCTNLTRFYCAYVTNLIFSQIIYFCIYCTKIY